MLTAALTWFTGTSAGRWILGALGIVLGLLGLSLAAYEHGKSAKEAEDAQDALEALRDREKTDEEVKNLSDSDLDGRLSKWVR